MEDSPDGCVKLGMALNKDKTSRTSEHPLDLPPEKIKFLKERHSARQSLIKLLNKRGFRTSFDFELLKIRIETDSRLDTTEALRFINDRIVEKVVELDATALKQTESLQKPVHDEDGNEVMVRKLSFNLITLEGDENNPDYSAQTSQDLFMAGGSSREDKRMNTTLSPRREEDTSGDHSYFERPMFFVGADNEIDNGGVRTQDIPHITVTDTDVDHAVSVNVPKEKEMITTKFRCNAWSIVEQLRARAHDIGLTHSCHIKFTHPRSSGLKQPTEPNIILLSADIQHVEADAIVSVSIARQENDCGGHSPVRPDANEHDVQITGLRLRDVTRSTNIKTCKAIYRGVLPLFPKRKTREAEEESFTALVAVILNVLLMASSDGCTSVAFPVLGTGAFGYPVQEVVQIMFMAVRLFFDCAVSPIEKVIFVIQPSAEPIVKQLFLMENFSRRLNTVKVDGTLTAHKELQKNSTQMCETRFVIGTSFLQITSSDIKSGCDATKVLLILWREEHFDRNKRHPVLSSFCQSIQSSIYSEYAHLLKRSKLIVDHTSVTKKTLVHLYCKDDTDDVTVRAIQRGVKQFHDDVTSIAIPLPSDGSRTCQPQIAAKIVMKALHGLKPPHVVRVIVENGHHFAPFLDFIGKKYKLHEVPDVSRTFDNLFLLPNTRFPVGDIVIHVASDSEEKNKRAAKELKTTFGIKLMYIFKDT